MPYIGNNLVTTVSNNQTNIQSIYNTSLKMGRDSQNLIDFATTDDVIILRAANANQIQIQDGVIRPVTTNDIDLGSATYEFKNAWFDGTVTADAFAGPLTGNVTGTADVATVATTVTITDNESTNEDNAIIFTAGGDVDGGNIGLESDGTLTYNPSTGTVTATTFVGALTGNASGTAATVTGAAQSSITSLGTLTTLTVDNVIINGTTIGHTSDTDLITLADGVATVAGELDATSLDISGDADIDGTLEADAITVDGTALNEYIADTVGAMVTSNTESGITVAYQDGDNTIDFTVGTLNQDTTGNAATATALETARTIGGTSFNGSADIAVALAATATTLASARTIGGTSFNGSADIVPATITVADTTDTSSFVALFESATGNLAPKTDAGITYNAGTGVLTATGFSGPLVGNVTGNASGTAATVTTAAQSAITSLGTLTTLTVDNVIINGTTIGHTSDTDLITVADGVVTVAGEISVTTLDIGGTNVSASAAQLNELVGGGASTLHSHGGGGVSLGLVIAMG